LSTTSKNSAKAVDNILAAAYNNHLTTKEIDVITRKNSRYTPQNENEARLIQELCFAVGVTWSGGSTEIGYLDKTDYGFSDWSNELAFNCVLGRRQRTLEQFIDLILDRNNNVTIEINGDKVEISHESAKAIQSALNDQLGD
jgi:hypothetical protein